MPNTSPVQLPTGTAPTGLRRSTGPVLAIILISYFMIRKAPREMKPADH